MIDSYCSDTAIWRKRCGLLDDGTPVFDPEELSIRARIERGTRLVRDEHGEELLSDITLSTSASVQPGDRLVFDGREWPVMAVKPVSGLTGTELFREVRLYWQKSASVRGRTR